jgi:hypothetical protein
MEQTWTWASLQGRAGSAGENSARRDLCPADTIGAATARRRIRSAGSAGTHIAAARRSENRIVAGRPSEKRSRRGFRAARAVRFPARVGCCFGAVLAALSFVTGALAQAPGRYVQNDIQIKIGEVEFRVVSADVLQDKSIRINMVITNTSGYQQITGFRHMNQIQLVSDSLDRVAAVGKPEGQFMVDSEGIIPLVPYEAIKVSLKFRPLPEETKRVNLIAYPGAIVNANAINIRGIALFGP